ncbi:MAG: sorbosone dehydrogenase family protein [Gemmatimonadota bacterium]
MLVATACSSTPVGPRPPPPPPPPPGGPALAIQTVASGLDRPLYVTTPAGDPRLFIVEQSGRIKILGAAGTVLGTPFLDLSASVSNGGEQGLLGLAFHPSYVTNGLFFVSYTDGAGDSVVERYSVSGDPDIADVGSAVVILAVDQPFSNHNGGQILFGLDEMLYVFLGDGGGGGDPLNSGQDRGTLLGSILRIDINGASPYEIPSDNPFVGMAGMRGEIWAYGVRNPWRSSFDAVSGSLFIADVGQDEVEEVNAVPAARAGVNYGWNTMEGGRCFGAASCDQTGLTLPVTEYTSGEGCSITGGVVYRGSIATLAGHYLYSDFCSGFLRSFRLEGGVATDETTWNIQNLGSVSSFGVDSSGEVYVVDLGGRVSRLVSP